MIAVDKWAHGGLSCAIALTVFVGLEWAVGSWAVIPSVLTGALAGFGKELYDVKKNGLDIGDIDWADIIADAAGLLIALAVELINILN